MDVRRSKRSRREPTRFDPTNYHGITSYNVYRQPSNTIITRSMSRKCRDIKNNTVLSANNGNYKNDVTYTSKLEYLATIATDILENKINIEDPIDSHINYYYYNNIPVEKVGPNRLQFIYADDEIEKGGYSDTQLKMLTAGNNHDKWMLAAEENVRKWKLDNLQGV